MAECELTSTNYKDIGREKLIPASPLASSESASPREQIGSASGKHSSATNSLTDVSFSSQVGRLKPRSSVNLRRTDSSLSWHSISNVADERHKQRVGASHAISVSTPPGSRLSSRILSPHSLNVSSRNEMHVARDAVTLGENRMLSTMPLPALVSHLDTDMSQGLTSEQVATLLLEVGPNELAPPPRPNLLPTLLKHVKSSFVIIASCYVGLKFIMWLCYEFFDRDAAVKHFRVAELIAFFIILKVALDVFLEYSSAEGLSGLGKLLAGNATVRREGIELVVPGRELVPGDVVKVRAGDVVPADMRVLTSNDITCNQSVITGESRDVAKSVHANDPSAPFLSSMLYSSTSVVTGEGLGVVTATGARTVVGLIGENLKATEAEISPLDLQVDEFVTFCSKFALAGAVTYFVVALLTGYQGSSSSNGPISRSLLVLESFNRACSLAAVLFPGVLPVILVTFKSVYMNAMWQSGMQVRQGSTVDTLGCSTVICSDKTGTLTAGRMSAARVLALVRPQSSDEFDVLGFGLHPLVGVEPSGKTFPLLSPESPTVRFGGPPEAELDLSKDLTSKSSLDHAPSTQVLRAAAAAAYLSTPSVELIAPDNANDQWEAKGNMSEIALHVASHKAGLDLSSLSASHKLCPELGVSFSSSRKMSATVHELGTCTAFASSGARASSSDAPKFGAVRLPPGTTHFAIIKGAPDILLPSITSGLVQNGRGVECYLELEKITQSAIAKIGDRAAALASSALRVLLVAVRPLSHSEFIQLQSNKDADVRLDILKAAPLVLLALFGLLDPPRPEVHHAIELCRHAGIRVVMITGDQLITAKAIARDIGLVDDSTVARDCADLRAGQDGMLLPATELDELARTTSVWARAQPSDKIALVRSLQAQGQIVAMTGDGVNDAPALKGADIGVAMGISGTEVAKGSADAVLMDDNFNGVVCGVASGRQLFTTFQIFAYYIISVGFSKFLTLLVFVVTGMPMHMEEMQNLILGFSNNVVGIVLIFEAFVAGQMSRPPRAPGSGFISRTALTLNVIPWSMTFSLLITVSFAIALKTHTGFLHDKSLRGTIERFDFEEGKVACAFAGLNTSTGGFAADMAPFHCKCHVQTSTFAWVLAVAGEPTIQESWPDILKSSADLRPTRCNIQSGSRWCWPQEQWPPEEHERRRSHCEPEQHLMVNGHCARRTLKRSEQCTTEGLSTARNVAFVVQVMGYSLRLWTLRSADISCGRPCPSRNMPLQILLLAITIMCSLVSFSPTVSEWLIDSSVTPPLQLNKLAFLAIALSVLVAELLKVPYHAALRKIGYGEPSEEDAAEEAGKLKTLNYGLRLYMV